MLESLWVQHDRRRFLAHVAPWMSAEQHKEVATGLDRVLAWSASKASTLSYRRPSGKDPLLGAAFAGGAVLLWGVYPRQGDGGKVTLFPGSASRLAPPVHRAFASRLEHLQPGLRLAPNQNLCMSLQRLSHDEIWGTYAELLEEACEHSSALAGERA